MRYLKEKNPFTLLSLRDILFELMLLVQYSIFKYKNIICILQQVKNPKIHKEIHVTCEGDLAGVSALLLIARVAGGLKWGPSSHPAV